MPGILEVFFGSGHLAGPHIAAVECAFTRCELMIELWGSGYNHFQSNHRARVGSSQIVCNMAN